MHRSARAAILAVVFLTCSQPLLAADDSHGLWTPLVTKQDATGEIVGWKSFHKTPGTKTGDVWRLTGDGVLVCRGKPNGYLYTEKDYTDFLLRLQWRRAAGKPGKAGVLVRMTGPDKIWPASLEAQLNFPDAGDFWGLDGYTLSGPAERMKRIDESPFGKLVHVRHAGDFEKSAGQWNTYEIDASGGTVVLRINGHEANRATDCAIHPGKICLTSEGDEIHFRYVELRAK